jgi:hypothetical protein
MSLPSGWTVQGPQTSDGETGFQIDSGDGGIQGQVGILDLDNPTAPTSQVTALETEDITILALQVDGTEVGSTNVQVTEPVHLVTVAGESCARMGVQSTYQGSTSDGLYLNCRYQNILYNVMLNSTSLSTAQLDTAMSPLVDSWTWH